MLRIEEASGEAKCKRIAVMHRKHACSCSVLLEVLGFRIETVQACINKCECPIYHNLDIPDVLCSPRFLRAMLMSCRALACGHSIGRDVGSQ